jgi:hypothetical protein
MPNTVHLQVRSICGGLQLTERDPIPEGKSPAASSSIHLQISLLSIPIQLSDRVFDLRGLPAS